MAHILQQRVIGEILHVCIEFVPRSLIEGIMERLPSQDRNEPISKYYITRYLTFQALLESSVRDLPLPFPDAENNNETVINGLDLPLDVLKKIYWENASKLYGLK